MTTSLAYAKKQASRHASAPILVVTGLSREAACLGATFGWKWYPVRNDDQPRHWSAPPAKFHWPPAEPLLTS